MMHVRELGDGPPVLLLHPGPGLDGTVFLPGVELLARSHRVLLADLPGNGHSPEGDRNEWTLAGYARAVERLAQDLELRDWTLLGHSFGGFVALQHLVDFPGSAARIVASCTDASETPPPGAPEDPLAGLTGEQRERVAEGEAREQVAGSPQQLKDAWLRAGAAADRQRGGADADAARRALPARDGPPARLGRARGADRARLRRGARARDRRRAGPRDPARGGAPDRDHRAATGELLMLEGCGHFPFAEAPERYWPAVESWLLRTAAGTSA